MLFYILNHISPRGISIGTSNSRGRVIRNIINQILITIPTLSRTALRLRKDKTRRGCELGTGVGARCGRAERSLSLAVSGGIHSNAKDTDYWCHLGQSRMQCILITPIVPSDVENKELPRRGIDNIGEGPAISHRLHVIITSDIGLVTCYHPIQEQSHRLNILLGVAIKKGIYIRLSSTIFHFPQFAAEKRPAM